MQTLVEERSSALRLLVTQILASHPDFNAERVLQAVDLIEHLFTNSMHWTGVTMIEHITGTLHHLLRFEPDEEAIVACILYKAPKSPELSLLHLEDQFGSKMRRLVSDIHILSNVTLQGKRMTLHDLRLMMISVSDDLRTILIALANFAQVSQQLRSIDHERQKEFSRDVLHLFAPVAARLGIYSIKQELESAAFPVLYPSDYERISSQFEQLITEHGEFFAQVPANLADFLHEKSMTCQVISRTKLPYSIFMKMREKSVTDINDIPDLFAIRVLVNSEADCYQTLGLLHQYARSVPSRFKDYISFPKPNGYQSVHTTLVNVPGAPESLMIEVQIRTKQMHREAELGVAAHWSYKEVGSTVGAMNAVQLQRILAGQETLDDGEHMQFVNHIFALTPNGDIIELPEGATPLDFAFHIHTDLGLSFKGARINGTMVSLQHQIENGDIVEILKHSSPQPSAQWMQVLKTASARAKLKRYLYAQQRPQLISQGKKLLNDQLRKRSLPLLDTENSFLAEVDGKKLSAVQREDILVKIGQGAESSSSIFMRIVSAAQKAAEPELEAEVVKEMNHKIVLEDGIQMPHQFAKCCKAGEVYGAIVGLVNRSGTVMIHRKQCKMIRNANTEKMLKAKFA